MPSYVAGLKFLMYFFRCAVCSLFTVAGMIGLAATLFAMRSYAYRALSERYESEAQEPEMAEPSIA